MRAELRYLANILVIDNFRHYPQRKEIGNPYNTLFKLYITSDGFTGIAPCEYDIDKFKTFVAELEELNRYERKNVELHEGGYGSTVNFYMDRTGELIVSGTIFGEAAEHKLTFVFHADQNALTAFINQLTDNIAKKYSR